MRAMKGRKYIYKSEVTVTFAYNKCTHCDVCLALATIFVMRNDTCLKKLKHGKKEDAVRIFVMQGYPGTYVVRMFIYHR